MRGIITALLGIGVTGALAQTPAAVRLPDTSTPMASTAATTLRNQFGLWKCVTASTVTCYGVYSRKQAGAPGDYAWSQDYWSKFKLFDNFHIEHPATRGYYVNGRGLPQATVTLGPNESIWYALEFADAADDINKASVIVPDDRGYGKLQLTAPVGKELSP
jgi:hypothetical protein